MSTSCGIYFYLEIEYKLGYQYLKGSQNVIRKAKTSDNRQIAELCYLIWRYGIRYYQGNN